MAVVAIVFVSCQLPLWSWQYIDIIDSLVGTKVKVALVIISTNPTNNVNEVLSI